LLDHLLDRPRTAAHRAGAAHVAHGPEADRLVEELLAGEQLGEGRARVEHPVALEDLALVREVDARDLELLLADVRPDVELGPVGDGEHAEVLALAEPRVVEAPEL